jgi:hypothetical protein
LVNAGDREDAEHGIAGNDQQHVTACGRGPLVRSQQRMQSGGVAELGLAQVGHHRPEARIRDISAAAGLTGRTVQAIVADLEAAGYITRSRTGRRTRYTVRRDSQFRHPAQEGLQVGPFLALLAVADEEGRTTPGPESS